MVLPWPIVEAAETGDVTTVREWLESGGDPNDRTSGGGTTALIEALAGPDEISEAHVDVARLLIARGANVNHADSSNGWGPLHCCTVYPERSWYGPIIGLLLEAGANVHAKTLDGQTPLGVTLGCSIWDQKDAASSCLDVVTRFLRAGAGLDAIQRDRSAEDMLRDEEANNSGLPPDFYACKALVSDYRAAGSTWKGYVRALPKELLRLRSLVARGRAREKVRTRSKTPREIALLFAPTFPNELCWRVLEYWNPRS